MKQKINKDLGFKIYEFEFKKTRFTILDKGMTLYKIEVKKDGIWKNIILSYDTLEQYKGNPIFLGTSVGRSAGRIEGGTFELEGKQIIVEKNEDGKNNHHGGPSGLHSKFFDIVVKENIDEIVMSGTTKLLEVEDKFPGDLNVRVIYTFREGEFKINFKADSNVTTFCNLTNHTYFNLSGNLERDINEHIIKIPSVGFWEIKPNNIPYRDISLWEEDIFNGIELSVINNPKNKTFSSTKGFDNPIDLKSGKQLELSDPQSGITLKASSSHDIVVLYSQGQDTESKFLNDKNTNNYKGLAIEFQNFPNGINYGQQESVLKAGIIYDNWMKYTIEF